MDFISIDIETLGLLTEGRPECDMIQLSMVWCKDGVPIEKCPSITIHFLPFNEKHYVGDLQAIVMHANILKDMLEYKGEYYHTNIANPNGEECYFNCNSVHAKKLIYNWLQKISPYSTTFNVAGKNLAGFDLVWMEKHKLTVIDSSSHIDYKFHHRTLDPAPYFVRKGDTTMPNLTECIKRAGLQSELDGIGNLHDSLYDARITAMLVRAGQEGCEDKLSKDFIWEEGSNNLKKMCTELGLEVDGNTFKELHELIDNYYNVKKP